MRKCAASPDINTESQNVWGWKRPLEIILSNPPFTQGQPDQRDVLVTMARDFKEGSYLLENTLKNMVLFFIKGNYIYQEVFWGKELKFILWISSLLLF